MCSFSLNSGADAGATMQGDAFKTLFISRISFETTEKKLRREFEEYGPIKRIRLVHDAAGMTPSIIVLKHAQTCFALARSMMLFCTSQDPVVDARVSGLM